jgi:predicted metal-dependent hydrolase
VYPDGRVVVSVPLRVSPLVIERFVASKKEWIEESLKRFAARPVSPHKLKSSRTDFKKYKEIARMIVKEKILQFNEYYKFKVGQIAIKNQKSRWGSCSRKGNININYKIALLPTRLADYLIVHELCHLGQFNHSQKFWDLVGETIPDYKDRMKELKGY